MLSLLIDTSTELLLAAIVKDHQLLFQAHFQIGHKSSSFLLPEIDKGFNKLNLKIKDLDSIVVGNGPGSYTGIRMGVITAKSLAFAANLPLIGLSTLHAFTPEIAGKFAVLIDAGISGVYYIKGNREEGKISYEGQPSVSELDNLHPILEDTSSLISPNYQRIKAKIEKAYPQFSPQWMTSSPDPLHMYHLALSKFRSKDYSLNGEIEIQYLRRTQAEIEYEKKRKLVD